MNACVPIQEMQHLGPALVILIAFIASFILMAVVAVKLLICCKIFANAGYSWALGLLILIPIVNIIMMFYLAFADWPVNKELRELKQKLIDSSS
jgi:uncharacterized membrane protein YhaH (DUF805 family)